MIKEFAHGFVLQMEKAEPALYLTKMSKAARKDRIFLDYLRNERGATAVAAFSPRARPGLRFRFPMHWSELDWRSGRLRTLRISRIGRGGWMRSLEAVFQVVAGDYTGDAGPLDGIQAK